MRKPKDPVVVVRKASMVPAGLLDALGLDALDDPENTFVEVTEEVCGSESGGQAPDDLIAKADDDETQIKIACCTSGHVDEEILPAHKVTADTYLLNGVAYTDHFM